VPSLTLLDPLLNRRQLLLPQIPLGQQLFHLQSIQFSVLVQRELESRRFGLGSVGVVIV